MPTLGLSMIVRNGAATLRYCLESARGLVDAMIIGDTGSTDDTTAIAREFGARVLPIDWRDDFAAARNIVVAALDTDWILTLDADEELPAESHAWIRAAIESPDIVAYLVQVRNYLSPHLPQPLDQVILAAHERHARAPDAIAYFPSACCRLFRRQPGIVYRGRVHELVDYNLPALGNGVMPAGFTIHHFGWYLADATRTAQKRRLYCDLLARKMEEMPDDPNTLVRYAALLSEDGGQPEEALRHARRAAELDGSAAGAWLFTGMILRRMGRYEEALDALERVPPVDQPAFRAQLRGDALYGLGRLEEAGAAYREACRLAPLDRLIEAKLGLLEVRTGATVAGLSRLRRVVEAEPRLADAEELLICALLAAEQRAEAGREAEALARRHGSPEAWLRVVRVYARAAEWSTALHFIDLGLAVFPSEHDLHAFRVNAAVAVGALDRAAEAAGRVVELRPTPRSILRLAAVLSHAGKNEAANKAMEHGLKLFPGSNVLTGVPEPAEGLSHATVH